jgi:uncharacterized RDD family membrane protein YckC
MNLEHRPDLHRVTTPEGLDLHLPVAGVGERIYAFSIDLSWLLLLWLAVLLLLALLAHLGAAGGSTFALSILILFLSWTFYFPFFELRWNGATPGKRRLKLRVIRADGGQLTPEAILARNFLRTVELQVPMIFLLAPNQLFPGRPGWLQLIGGLWILALMLLPLCNRARMRAGDFVAGTRVVNAPDPRLLPELVRLRPKAADRKTDADPSGPHCEFTREQLDIYGIYELQVLEDVLRKVDTYGGLEAASAVATQIQQKIGFVPPSAKLSSRVFLEEFYAAQRRHLEQKLLFGKRQQKKRDFGRKPDSRSR